MRKSPQRQRETGAGGVVDRAHPGSVVCPGVGIGLFEGWASVAFVGLVGAVSSANRESDASILSP